jgi:hypothetical protein
VLAPPDTPSSVVAALPSDLLLLVAVGAAVLAWTALRRRGVRSGPKRLFSATRNGVSVTELKPGEVNTVVHIDVEGDAMDPRSRAKLDEQLDKLGIDRSEIDEKLDRGQTHIHAEHDSPPQT